MNHAERRRLIDGLTFTFRIIERKTHAGTLIAHELPTEGRKRPSSYAWDESYGGASSATDIEDLIAAWEG